MRTLWFKGRYEADILSGAKIDTIRPRSNRLPALGERVACSVGPRKPFAEVMVTAIEPLDDVSPERRAQLVAIYGEVPPNSVRLTFQLLAPDDPAGRLF